MSFSSTLDFLSLDLTVNFFQLTVFLKTFKKLLTIFLTAGKTTQNAPYTKKFMYPTHYVGSWTDAFNICNSFKMNLLSLDSQAEATQFLSIFVANFKLFDKWTHIGAVTTVKKSPTEWYWVNTRQKVNFPLKFTAGNPDNYLDSERCLVLTIDNENYGFNDNQCHDQAVMKFICQIVV